MSSKIGTANLRVSLAGGGMDRSEHFTDFEMPILTEGINRIVTCTKPKNGKFKWHNSLKGVRGLGSSGARHLSLLRACLLYTSPSPRD